MVVEAHQSVIRTDHDICKWICVKISTVCCPSFIGLQKLFAVSDIRVSVESVQRQEICVDIGDVNDGIGFPERSVTIELQVVETLKPLFQLVLLGRVFFACNRVYVGEDIYGPHGPSRFGPVATRVLSPTLWLSAKRELGLTIPVSERGAACRALVSFSTAGL